MKLVREHINEKFTQDSDPVHDMGIGGVTLVELRKKHKKDFKVFVKNFFRNKTITATMILWYNPSDRKMVIDFNKPAKNIQLKLLMQILLDLI